MLLLTDSIIISATKRFIYSLYCVSELLPEVIMAEAADADPKLINVDREWADCTIDEACKWTGDIILRLTDLGDAAKEVCDQGKYNDN